MLDTIAWDCMYLRRPDLEEIWAGALEYGDGVIYISEATREQFHGRFPLRPGLHEAVIHLSLDPGEYSHSDEAKDGGSFLLLVGNSFAHKRVAETAAALSAAFPDLRIVCLGGKGSDYKNVRFHESGRLPHSFVEQLFRDARAVIFPSLYEGFGLPILRGLGWRKPVIARSIPPTRELAAQLQHPANLLLYSSTSDLLDLLQSGIPAWQPETISSNHTWAAVTEEIANVIEHLLNRVQTYTHYEEILIPRIRYSQEGFANKQMAVANKQMAHRVTDLENSFSWRITRPLRMLADVYLGLRKS
jgi:glycosyltransferase involved in cell wall biosynthesis